MLVGARLAQGAGAGDDGPGRAVDPDHQLQLRRRPQQGARRLGAISGLAAAAGVFLGGVLSQGPGWRWVLFVNLPACALILVGAFRLVPGGRAAARAGGFDVPGAVLGTAGMLLLIYALVRAPGQGWGSARTIGELATAGVLLAAFTVTGLRRRDPLFPFSIFRVKGLAASNAVQMIAFAAFVSVFYFLTLYMQNVVGYSPIRSGSAYLPVTAGIIVAAGVCAKLHARTGTRPVIAAGALLAAAGVWYLSRIPVHGTYPRDLLPRAGDHGGRHRRRPGLRHHRRQRRRPGGQGRARRKPAERLPAARHRPRPGHLLRHRHRPHQRAAHRARHAAASTHRGLPPRPAGLRRLPARRRRHRAARHGHPRRARRGRREHHRR